MAYEPEVDEACERAKDVVAGSGFLVHVCPECGRVEGDRPQAGCCPGCGIASDPIICWANVDHRVTADELERIGP